MIIAIIRGLDPCIQPLFRNPVENSPKVKKTITRSAAVSSWLILRSAYEFGEHLNERWDVCCPRRLYRADMKLRGLINLFGDAAALQSPSEPPVRYGSIMDEAAAQNPRACEAVTAAEQRNVDGPCAILISVEADAWISRNLLCVGMAFARREGHESRDLRGPHERRYRGLDLAAAVSDGEYHRQSSRTAIGARDSVFLPVHRGWPLSS
ncbi:MAG: hypothetical protein ACYC5H_03760 [Methylovirgula sp.]